MVTPIYKEGDKSPPENYRAIALLSIPGKVLTNILLSKIREKTEVFTSDRQYGFRPNRGTIDAIFIVRPLMQKSKERGINCHFHFVDFKNAFDTTWRKALWRMMISIGICNKIVSIIEKMYEKTTCAVVADGLLTEWFSVSVGVRQGCLLAPTLFNLFLDFVMDKLKCLQENATLDNDLNFDARYADDTTLIAAVFEKLQLATDQLQETCKKYGMKICTDKCKVISNSHTNITIENENVENVEEFKFLGSVVPNSSLDVKRRIATANSAFGKLKKSVWSRRDIPKRLKLRLYNVLILPITIYPSETWSLTKQDTKKLNVFENNCLRAILNNRLLDRVSIKEIRKRAKQFNPI